MNLEGWSILTWHYMGCHPKPIDELILFKMVIDGHLAPPTRLWEICEYHLFQATEYLKILKMLLKSVDFHIFSPSIQSGGRTIQEFLSIFAIIPPVPLWRGRLDTLEMSQSTPVKSPCKLEKFEFVLIIIAFSFRPFQRFGLGNLGTGPLWRGDLWPTRPTRVERDVTTSLKKPWVLSKSRGLSVPEHQWVAHGKDVLCPCVILLRRNAYDGVLSRRTLSEGLFCFKNRRSDVHLHFL